MGELRSTRKHHIHNGIILPCIIKVYGWYHHSEGADTKICRIVSFWVELERLWSEKRPEKKTKWCNYGLERKSFTKESINKMEEKLLIIGLPVVNTTGNP